MSETSYFQEELWPSPIEQLDEARGVVQGSVEDASDAIDIERRITLARMVDVLGQNMGPKDYVGETSDPVLEVATAHFGMAEPNVLKNGLYIPAHDLRYRSAEQLVTVSDQKCDLMIPGVVWPNVGVVFPADEFPVVARNARDLVRHVQAKTRRANEGSSNHEEIDAKVGRSAAHAMDSKIGSLNNLENTLIDERRILERIYREARTTWSAHHTAGKLDKIRKEADEIIHEMAETASINLNIGSVAIKAMHRAITSNLYRRGSRAELNAQWRRYSAFVGRYTNARRGKVVASRNACQKQLIHYAKYLEASSEAA